MDEQLSENFCQLKREFSKTYQGRSHIQEILPVSSSDFLPINEDHLRLLHQFASKNPIYHNSYEQKILDVNCTVYEGDINQYWINSLKNDGSAQPFYPTWIFSAYLTSIMAKTLGFEEIVDIGSGDGRIAFCGKIIGLETHAIEIDEFLVELQRSIIAQTNINFHANCANAVEFDFLSLSLKRPAIFTGGLPQMGDVLTSYIIEKVTTYPQLKQNSCFVLAGTKSKKQLSVSGDHGGWEPLIKKFGMQIIKTISLPTVWTFDQEDETPYIYSVLPEFSINSK